jgi:hypothetical protein
MDVAKAGTTKKPRRKHPKRFESRRLIEHYVRVIPPTIFGRIRPNLFQAKVQSPNDIGSATNREGMLDYFLLLKFVAEVLFFPAVVRSSSALANCNLS